VGQCAGNYWNDISFRRCGQERSEQSIFDQEQLQEDLQV
jgi:hypothetical protein